MYKSILEFISFTFSSVKIHQRVFVLGGVIFYMISLYLAPLLLQFLDMNINISILIIIIAIMLIAPFTISSVSYMEIVLRDSVYDLFRKKIDDMSRPSTEIEAVHYTGSLEKYVWSLTDSIKNTLAALVPVILLLFSGWIGFVVSTIIFLFIYLLSSSSMPTVYRIRKLIIASNKKLVINLDNKMSAGEQIENSANRYVKHRAFMTLWRAKIHTFSACISALFILVGMFLLQRGNSGGAVLASTGFIVGGVITKMIDSYVVMLSESLHIDELKVDL